MQHGKLAHWHIEWNANSLPCYLKFQEDQRGAWTMFEVPVGVHDCGQVGRHESLPDP